MKILISLLFLIFASIAISQNETEQKESWQTILENDTLIHQVETTTVYHENNTVFYFIHRTIFKNPLTIQDKKITHIITLNAINCSRRVSTVISDLVYSKDTIVMKNAISDITPIATPDIGTPHHIMMLRLCAKNTI